MESETFRAAWLNPRFLHYRVPVYRELNNLLDGGLSVLYSAERVPLDVQEMLHGAIGDNSFPLRGEKTIRLSRGKGDFANKGFQIPWQPNLVRTLRDVRPDVIIAEGFFQWAPAGFWLKFIKRTPVVVAYERTEHTERNAGMLRLWYRKLAARYVDAVIVNGTLSKEYCQKILAVHKNYIISGAMTADTEYLSIARKAISDAELLNMETSLSLQRPIFLVVGRLVRPKGVWELLESWEKYLKSRSGPTGSLLFVGDGPERTGLEAFIRDRNLKGIVFTGQVNNSEIAGYYALCDVLISPTLEDNWGLVVHEAMACSKPVICSCYNGCWPELIREDVNGWKYDPLKTEELVNLFKLCTTQKELLKSMGKKSKEISLSFSPKRAAGSILEACKIAIKNHKK